MENIYFNKLGLQTLSLNFALNGKQIRTQIQYNELPTSMLCKF
jgi:hypothetical protein